MINQLVNSDPGRRPWDSGGEDAFPSPLGAELGQATFRMERLMAKLDTHGWRARLHDAGLSDLVQDLEDLAPLVQRAFALNYVEETGFGPTELPEHLRKTLGIELTAEERAELGEYWESESVARERYCDWDEDGPPTQEHCSLCNWCSACTPDCASRQSDFERNACYCRVDCARRRRPRTVSR
jgi:hypothetical protein